MLQKRVRLANGVRRNVRCIILRWTEGRNGGTDVRNAWLVIMSVLFMQFIMASEPWVRANIKESISSEMLSAFFFIESLVG